MLATLLNVDYTINGLSLKAISPATDSVWTVFNVRMFYVSDMLILLFLIIVSLLLLKLKMKDKIHHIFLWVHFASILLFFAVTLAGILTKTGSYYFFRWVHMSFYQILMLAFVLIITGVLAGIYLRRLFTKYNTELRPSHPDNFRRYQFRYLIKVFIPVTAGIALYSLQLFFTSNNSLFLELILVELFTLSALLDAWGYSVPSDKTTNSQS